MDHGQGVAVSATVDRRRVREYAAQWKFGVPTLDPEDWSLLKEVFEGARALPIESRPAYLAEACHDNPALRLEVEQLLASHERAATFLEKPVVLVDEGIETTTVSSVPVYVGRYRVTDTLGEGGMGVVYAAVDEQLERPIAVKVLRHERAADPTARERFWREARLAASVNHPHICQLYEIGESDGQLFIAMERLEGEPLAARLSRGTMLIAETVRIGLDVLSALDALHRRGITHRDLKPSNVYLTPHGAKVLDFGVSLRQTDETTRLPLTSPGTMLGTPRYMAPEQVLGEVVTASADLFALGAILYEMLSGTPSRPTAFTGYWRRCCTAKWLPSPGRRRWRRSIVSFIVRSQNRLRSDMPVRRRWPRISGRRLSWTAARAIVEHGLSRVSWCCRSGC